MDISDLRAFVMLAETLNFTRSAEAMFVSQSTFSRQISRLEAEMGAPLFARSPRSVSLTDYGQVFLPEARAQIAAWENTLRHMEQVRQGLLGSLSVGFVQDNPNDHFPEILREFRKRYPRVDVQFREYGQGPVTLAIDSGEVDAAFSFDEGIYQCQSVRCRILERSPIRAVLWKGNPLCKKEGIMLRELSEEPMVFIRQEVSIFGYQNVLERCRRAGFTPDIAATANIIPSLFMLVESNLGFTFLPDSARRIAPEGVEFVPILDCADEIATVLAWREDNENPCLKSFLNTAAEVCGFSM